MKVGRMGTHGQCSDRIAFAHIPKTAGTSLQRDAQRLDFSVASSEQCIPTMLAVSQANTGLVLATMFREPHAHLLSLYRECKNGFSSVPPRQRPTAERLATDAGFTNWTAAHATGEAAGWRCYSPNNMQTRALLCGGSLPATPRAQLPPDRENLWYDSLPASDAPSNRVSAARKLVRKVPLVGISAHYQATVCVWLDRLPCKAGVPLPAWCDCRSTAWWDAPLGHFSESRHYNYEVSEKAATTLTSAANSTLAPLVESDLRVYATAMRRFARDVAATEARHNVSLCLRRRPTHAQPDDRSRQPGRPQDEAERGMQNNEGFDMALRGGYRRKRVAGATWRHRAATAWATAADPRTRSGPGQDIDHAKLVRRSSIGLAATTSQAVDGDPRLWRGGANALPVKASAYKEVQSCLPLHMARRLAAGQVLTGFLGESKNHARMLAPLLLPGCCWLSVDNVKGPRKPRSKCIDQWELRVSASAAGDVHMHSGQPPVRAINTLLISPALPERVCTHIRNFKSNGPEDPRILPLPSPLPADVWQASGNWDRRD